MEELDATTIALAASNALWLSLVSVLETKKILDGEDLVAIAERIRLVLGNPQGTVTAGEKALEVLKPILDNLRLGQTPATASVN